MGCRCRQFSISYELFESLSRRKRGFKSRRDAIFPVSCDQISGIRVGSAFYHLPPAICAVCPPIWLFVVRQT